MIPIVLMFQFCCFIFIQKDIHWKHVDSKASMNETVINPFDIIGLFLYPLTVHNGFQNGLVLNIFVCLLFPSVS